MKNHLIPWSDMLRLTTVLQLGFLVACGLSVNVRSVDPAIEPVAASLLADLALAYPGLVTADPEREGIAIVVDYERTVSSLTTTRGGATWFPSESTILMPVPGIRYNYLIEDKRQILVLSYGSVKMFLAHELGHALGLGHSATGLMHPNGDYSCVGKEATCLVEALSGPR